MGGQELCFLNIDDSTGFCHRFHQVRLAGQEGRQLDNVTYFSGWCCLIWLMDIGDQGDIEGIFDLLQDLQAFIQARATERGQRRAVSLIKGCLEHIGDVQATGNFNIVLSDLHRQIPGFKYIHAAKKNHWQFV